MSKVLHATRALLPDGWHTDVRVTLAGGRIAEALANGSIILIHAYFRDFCDGAIPYGISQTLTGNVASLAVYGGP